MEYKKQHWVPQSYLRAWCDPNVDPLENDYVWVFQKDGTLWKRKAPENIFFEPDMYTIHLDDGTRILDIEHGLSGLESLFTKIRRESINIKSELSPNDILIILAFIAASFERTKMKRDYHKKFWGEIVEYAENLKKYMLSLSPEERKRKSVNSSSGESSLSLDDAKRLAENPLQEMLIASINTSIEMFRPMCLRFLHTTSKLGFITSDAPCVWFDREAYKRPFPYNQPGLAFPTIEITLPVSPHFMAYLTWKGNTTYIEIPDYLVNEYNRRTRYFCNEYFVVNQKIL